MHFFDLPTLLRPGDCLVLNDSRVLPARLLGHREPAGGAVEVLLLIDRGDKVWECLVRPGRKLKPGTRLSFGDGSLKAEVVEVCEGGNRLVRFEYEGIFLETLERLGRQGWQGRCRLLPYQAVGVECGMLLALRLDGARVGTEDYGKLLLALSPTRLTDGGGYHALIGT